jgi:hypothetical protein
MGGTAEESCLARDDELETKDGNWTADCGCVGWWYETGSLVKDGFWV